MDMNGAGPALAGVCVLVVEDNDAMRTALRRFLDRAGCTVLEAGSPTCALEAARNHAGRVDMALVDLILPEMSGPECADQLVEERPDMVVAYMSGYAESVSGGLPGDDTPVLLQKPFARDELIDTVQRLLGMSGPQQLSYAHC